MEKVKPRRGRPSEGAREAVMEAALELFMEHDYADVSTAAILERAGVSRGALYHHFESKRDLYRAVWQDTERRLLERILEAAADAKSPFELLEMASLVYLDEAADNRELQRIGLLQSRTVLGWEAWREGISELGLATTSAVVEAAMDAGELRRADPRTVAHLILASLIEAALLIATAADPSAARAASEPVLMAMLDGLRAR